MMLIDLNGYSLVGLDVSDISLLLKSVAKSVGLTGKSRRSGS